MYHCLRITDIALEIVGWLPRMLKDDCCDDGCAAYNPDGSVERHDALAFALTCKSFLHPGLDALWYHMQSLEPLVARLTPEGFGDLQSWAKTSPNQITRSDTNRFNFYAHRIRILHTSYRDTNSASEYRLLSLSVLHHRCPMLPNLQHVIWNHPLIETFPYLTLFASESLRSLTLFPFPSSLSYEGSLFSTISTFAAHSPSLDSVTFNGKFIPTGESDSCHRQTALLLSALHFVSFVAFEDTLSSDALFYLARMPELFHLFANCGNSRIGLGLPKALPTQLDFAALRNISIEHVELLELVVLLEAFPEHHNELDTIDIVPKECFPSSLAARFIRAVCRACSPDVLAWLQIQGNGNDTHKHLIPYVLHHTVFSPLFEFRDLETLSISCCESDFDDGILEDFASAWPPLQILALRTHASHPSKLTFGGLFPLAKHCPELYMLELHLAPWSEDLSLGLRKRDWELHSSALPLSFDIRCYHSPELEFAATAYLEDIFPNLKKAIVVNYPK